VPSVAKTDRNQRPIFKDKKRTRGVAFQPNISPTMRVRDKAGEKGIDSKILKEKNNLKKSHVFMKDFFMLKFHYKISQNPSKSDLLNNPLKFE
jgi:hypothetical protein